MPARLRNGATIADETADGELVILDRRMLA